MRCARNRRRCVLMRDMSNLNPQFFVGRGSNRDIKALIIKGASAPALAGDHSPHGPLGRHL